MMTALNNHQRLLCRWHLISLTTGLLAWSVLFYFAHQMAFSTLVFWWALQSLPLLLFLPIVHRAPPKTLLLLCFILLYYLIMTVLYGFQPDCLVFSLITGFCLLSAFFSAAYLARTRQRIINNAYRLAQQRPDMDELIENTSTHKAAKN